MAISENNRKRFEGIGLEKIRRELTVGDYHYIPVDDTTQAEAREWAAEQEAKLEKEKKDARELEARRFRSVLGWTIAGVVVTVVAAAAIIAAGPVIKEWIERGFFVKVSTSTLFPDRN